MENNLNKLCQAVRAKGKPARAKTLLRFFKTGKGEYGEGDQFLGLTVPEIRSFAKSHSELSYPDLTILLKSKWHEERMLALFILVEKTKIAKKKNDFKTISSLKQFYLKNKKGINNWDLVDLSAMYVLGPYYHEKGASELYKMARSKDMWTRRIAMMTSFYFVRLGQFDEAIKLAEILLKDEEDLIHKASGWMLREIGKRNKKPLLNFLHSHAAIMPRTMLRYSLEKLSVSERKRFMEMKKKTNIVS